MHFYMQILAPNNVMKMWQTNIVEQEKRSINYDES
jgi:hypothetical protein